MMIKRLCLTLSSLAIISGCSVSESDERAIGSANAAQVDSQLPIVHDTAVDRFVTELGRSMASRTSRADLD